MKPLSLKISALAASVLLLALSASLVTGNPSLALGSAELPNAYKAAEIDLEKEYWKSIYPLRDERYPRNQYNEEGFKKIGETVFGAEGVLDDFEYGLHGFMESELDFDLRKFENWFRESRKTVLNRYRISYGKRLNINGEDVDSHLSVDGRTNIYDVTYQLHRDNRFDLHEAWFKWLGGRYNLSAGRQLFAWGVVDGDRPTDTLNPQDYYKWLVPWHQERKIPVWSISADIFINPYNDIEFVWLPVFELARQAGNETDWLTEEQQRVEYYRAMTDIPVRIDETTPDGDLQQSTLAFRYRSATPEEKDIDFSFGFIMGWHYDPLVLETDFVLRGSEDVPTRIRLLHERRNLLTTDWSTAYIYDREDGTKGKLGIRGETAYEIGKPFSRRYYSSKTSPVINKDFVESVLEVDHRFNDENLYMNFQLRSEFVVGHDEFVKVPELCFRARYHFIQDLSSLFGEIATFSDETLRWLRTGELRAGKKIREIAPDRMNLNLLMDYSFTLADYMARAWIVYKMTHSTTVQAGVNYFGGNTERDRFSQFDDNDEVFLKARYDY